MKTKIIGYKWLTSAKGSIGIVLYYDTQGLPRAGISAVDGESAIDDIIYIIKWGAKFPTDVAILLIDQEGMKVIKEVEYDPSKP